MRKDLRERKAWQVTMVAHEVSIRGRRYRIAKREQTRFEASARDAKAMLIRESHIDAGAPPLRPLLRQSWAHTSAVETTYTPG